MRPAPATHPPIPDEFRAVIRDAARLNRVHAILDHPAPIAEVADRVVLALSELFAAEIVAILRPDGPLEDGGTLVPLALIGLPDEGRGTVFVCRPGGPACRAVRTGAPVFVDDAAAEPVLETATGDLGVVSAVVLPLAGARTAAGLLLLARCRPPAFTRADGDLLLAIAHPLAMAIERADADEERRRTDELRARAEKAESLARVAAAVAHHFNNKLTAVLGYLELARDAVGPDSSARRDLASAREAAREAGHVGRLLLDYLGADPEPRVAVDLVALVREGLAQAIPGLPEGVTLETDLRASALPVVGAPGQLREILDHVLANAVEAAQVAHAGRGRVRVRLRAVGSRGARQASLEVADTGPGMRPDEVRVAFEPFWTTKAPGRGLGLPAALGLARAHGGAVTLESDPAKGTVVRVLLPLAGEPGPPPSR